RGPPYANKQGRRETDASFPSRHPVSAPALPMITHVVRTDAEWDALRAEWAALFVASPRAAPPLHFDWLRTWWRVYGPHYGRPGSLRILTIRRGPELVGVLPLYLQVTGPGLVGLRRLRFLSTGEA